MFDHAHCVCGRERVCVHSVLAVWRDRKSRVRVEQEIKAKEQDQEQRESRVRSKKD